MIKEAIEYLTKLGTKPEEHLVEHGEYLFQVDKNGKVAEILPEVFNAKYTVNIKTLTGMVDYIKSNLERKGRKFYLHVEDEETISLFGTLEIDGSRERLITAKAITPNIIFDRFIDTEELIIALQSKFVNNVDREILLKVLGNVVEDNVKSVGDDGVSQSVAIRQGVASKAEVKVPNPVVLAPYRTFLEVEQPESQFIFRMKEGPRGAIIEADGGAWRNEAILNIKGFLEDELKQEIEEKEITIIA